MDEILWFLGKRSQTLQHFRADIRGTWDDEAAKDLNLRYLNPHEEDNQQMLASLQYQQGQIHRTQTELEAAHQHSIKAEYHSQQVQQSLRHQVQESQQAYHCLGVATESYKNAQASLPAIEHLMHKANAACSLG